MAYLGPPTSLADVVLDRPHSLLEQASHPRHQSHGRVNADGFGVGWYDDEVRVEPARYRRAVPIWADRSFASVAGLVRSPALLASVRDASPGLPIEESGAAPFTSGPWLFSLNGIVNGWHDGAGPALRAQLSPARAAAIEGASDAEVLFGLFLDRVASGALAVEALADVVAAVEALDGGRLNLLATDGRTIAATVWGDTLFVLSADDAVVVASEPWDDDPAWIQLPDRLLVVADAGAIDTRTLTP